MFQVKRVGIVVLLAALVALGAVGWAADVKPLAEKDLVSLIELQIDDAAIAVKLKNGGLGFTADDAALARLRKPALPRPC